MGKTPRFPTFFPARQCRETVRHEAASGNEQLLGPSTGRYLPLGFFFAENHRHIHVIARAACCPWQSPPDLLSILASLYEGGGFAEGEDGGSVVLKIGHSPSLFLQTDSPLKEGAEDV